MGKEGIVVKKHLVSYKNNDKKIDGYSDKDLFDIIEGEANKAALFKKALRHYLNRQHEVIRTVDIQSEYTFGPQRPAIKKIVTDVEVPTFKVDMSEINEITGGE